MGQLSALIGIDIGTSGLKAAAFELPKEGEADTGNASGPLAAPIAESYRSYPLYSPGAGWVEQEPEEIWQAFLGALQEITAKLVRMHCKPAGLSFSGVMHSIFIVDDRGAEQTRMLTWADTRSAPQMRRIRNDLGLALYRRTGTPMHPMSPISKILWFKENGAALRRGWRFVSIKEWIVLRLTGEWVADISTASATGMFNLEKLAWDREALSYLGLVPEQLSRPESTLEVLPLSNSGSSFLGLPSGLPLVLGATDGVLANLGAGSVVPGSAAVTIGTSAAVRTVVKRPWTDPEGRVFCYALTEDHWVIGGGLNSGGIVMRWVRDQIAVPEKERALAQGIDPYTVMIQEAASIPAGAEGLIFLPYLTGERAPIWDDAAKGVFFGLSWHHNRSHIIRAALESVAYAVNSVYQVLQTIKPIDQFVRVSGGFTRSEFWRQLLADVLDVKLEVPDVSEASCYGAAVLAAKALGYSRRLEDSVAGLGVTAVNEPQAGETAMYRKNYELFLRIYEQNKQLFHAK
ncbi:glycerol kinase [Acididesulfobacillus acetoxydans]|uniref:Gluconokinase n=1 Tax=Acididesulfobacillus acetoxydans TaxID=1561005 RepID=A0A8S0XZZ4_9FIRM|nr:gluconokinase [Acididesulfobacillus acetoxydans]CAA7602677.1 glycerol kinase [Acididesulfobacillus acetoxydans]CEJ09150.1 Gluconokinase [Acididesulfobacillus acetoxydans]